MTADLTILPIGGPANTAEVQADVLAEIRQHKIVHQLTGTTTCLEGSWEQIVAVAKAAHNTARRHTPHVVTLLRIEDDLEGGNDLKAAVEVVEKMADESLRSAPPVVSPLSPPLVREKQRQTMLS